MDSITRIKNFISNCFPGWTKVEFSTIDENVNFREDWSDLYRIDDDELILISYTNISITGTERPKPQLRVFLEEYKKPFLFAKKHNLRFYLFSIFTKEDEMARGLNNFNPKEYIISIETNLDIEDSRRDLRSIYEYANEKLNGRKFLKCSRENYKADINQASFIYIGTPDAPEKETFESFINIFDSRPYLNSKIDTSSETTPIESIGSLQKIFYGAPGTGKSHEVKKQTGELSDSDEERDLPNVFRTTFHPDTDYASFVGCYKPAMRKTGKKHQVDGKDVDDEEIIYEFVPQAFTDAYIYAYTHSTEQTYLVIEEINRGNCAQIFGDLFQLLDRKNGVSEYKIKADKDLANYLIEILGEDSEGIKEGKLCLPANLNILATMNTSDQSLFPMDSAFKRRWEWEYVPINYGTDIKSGSFEITIGDKAYPWVGFIKEANKKIFDLTQSEDKQLGNFFIKHSVEETEFKSKVMFYLWYEVLRDETENNKYFFYKKTTIDDKEQTSKFIFKDLYEEDATQTLQQFMDYLGVPAK